MYYIQLGGLLDFKDESYPHSNRSKKEGKLIMILKTDWTRILSQVVREKDRLAYNTPRKLDQKIVVNKIE